MTGTTVCVIKLNIPSMIGFTVVLEKVTTWPTTPITDWSICTMPSNAPAAVSFPANMPPCPNSISRKPDSALATPPSTNSPLMKLPTLDSAPVNLSKMASPCSPNTPPTISRIYSRLSPSRLTTAIMLDTTPTTGSAPDSRVPKPPAIGPQILLSIPRPPLAAPPIAFTAPEPAIALNAPPALPSRPPTAIPALLPMMAAPALPSRPPKPPFAAPSSPPAAVPALPSRPLRRPPVFVFPMAVPIPPSHWPTALFAAAFLITLPGPT